MAVTDAEIRADIKKYECRLASLQRRLEDLPPKGRIPVEGRKLKKTRKNLESEIKLVKTWIGWAEDALRSSSSVRVE